MQKDFDEMKNKWERWLRKLRKESLDKCIWYIAFLDINALRKVVATQNFPHNFGDFRGIYSTVRTIAVSYLPNLESGLIVVVVFLVFPRIRSPSSWIKRDTI